MIDHRDDEEPADRLLLAEEIATIGKRTVSTGKIEVRTQTETFEEIVRSVLRDEHVDVTRVAIDRQVDVAPTMRTEGDLTIVPILEEVLFIEKRLILKEEIHIRRRVEERCVEMPTTLRRQHAVINRADIEEPISSTPISKDTP